MLKRSIRPIEKNDFYKELLSFAVPIGLQNLLVALIGASDALMLGRLTPVSYTHLDVYKRQARWRAPRRRW